MCACACIIYCYIYRRRYAHTLVEFVSFYTDGKKIVFGILLVKFILCRYYIDIVLLSTFDTFLCWSPRIQTCECPARSPPLKRISINITTLSEGHGLRVRIEIKRLYIIDRQNV